MKKRSIAYGLALGLTLCLCLGAYVTEKMFDTTYFSTSDTAVSLKGNLTNVFNGGGSAANWVASGTTNSTLAGTAYMNNAVFTNTPTVNGVPVLTNSSTGSSVGWSTNQAISDVNLNGNKLTNSGGMFFPSSIPVQNIRVLSIPNSDGGSFEFMHNSDTNGRPPGIIDQEFSIGDNIVPSGNRYNLSLPSLGWAWDNNDGTSSQISLSFYATNGNYIRPFLFKANRTNASSPLLLLAGKISVDSTDHAVSYITFDANGVRANQTQIGVVDASINKISTLSAVQPQMSIDSSLQATSAELDLKSPANKSKYIAYRRGSDNAALYTIECDSDGDLQFYNLTNYVASVSQNGSFSIKYKLVLAGSTNVVAFGATNTAPISSAAPTKWISVQVSGETNVYRLPLYE